MSGSSARGGSRWKSTGSSPSREQLDAYRTEPPRHDPLQRAFSAAQQQRAAARGHLPRTTRRRRSLDEVAPRARVRRDPATGEPTGVVNECIDWIFPRSSPWKYDELRRAIRQTCGEAVRFGVTSIHEFVSWPDSSRIYQELYREGELPLRVQLCPCVWGMQRTVEMDSLLNLGSADRLRQRLDQVRKREDLRRWGRTR